MSKFPENVNTLMKEIGILHQQCALLIKAADAEMGNNNWDVKQNQCVSVGNSLNYYDWWFPSEVWHFYESEAPGYQHLMPFVSIILRSRRSPDAVKRPLLTAGCFDYGAGAPIGKDYIVPYADAHVRIPNRHDDGTIAEATPKEIYSTEKQRHAKKVKTFGIPLESVNNQDELRAKVIEPLFTLMETMADMN